VKKKLSVQAIECLVCGDTVYSRATHDYRKCTCGRVAIDGGRDYTRVLYEREVNGVVKAKSKILKLNVTEKELYDDWNQRIDKYGIVNESV
jgi:hypothetical protein